MNTTTGPQTRPRTGERSSGPQSRADTTRPGRRPQPRLRGRFTQDPNDAARDEQAAMLHSQGVPYLEVASTLGYTSTAGATRAATRARQAECLERIVSTRAVLLDELERLELAALRAVSADHVRMYRGKPVLADPNDPTSTIHDPRPTLRAIDVCLGIMDRRAKLLGLYASHPGPAIGARR